MLLIPSEPLAPLIGVSSALLGACIGSFLNVVAWRLPREESVVHPSSHCPRCGTPLRWFENVPVVSWLLQRGRCRHCGTAIDRRYPLVELLTAGLFVAAGTAAADGLGTAPPALFSLLAGWLLVGLLLPLTLIDIDHLVLPEPLCRWGVLLGLLVTGVAEALQTGTHSTGLLFWHLLAASLGLLGFEAVSAAAGRLLGRNALGLGDAKLAAMLGAWLGLTGLGLMVAMAVVSGALFGVLGLLSGRLRRGQPFPFGPFLAAAGLTVWMVGNGPLLALLAQLFGWDRVA